MTDHHTTIINEPQPSRDASHQLGLALLDHLGIAHDHVTGLSIDVPAIGARSGSVVVTWESLASVPLADLERAVATARDARNQAMEKRA